MKKIFSVLLLSFFATSAQSTEIELTVIKTVILKIKSLTAICLCHKCFHELEEQDLIDYVCLVDKSECCCCGVQE